jgi:hypothetical protein
MDHLDDVKSRIRERLKKLDLIKEEYKNLHIRNNNLSTNTSQYSEMIQARLKQISNIKTEIFNNTILSTPVIVDEPEQEVTIIPVGPPIINSSSISNDISIIQPTVQHPIYPNPPVQPRHIPYSPPPSINPEVQSRPVPSPYPIPPIPSTVEVQSRPVPSPYPIPPIPSTVEVQSRPVPSPYPIPPIPSTVEVQSRPVPSPPEQTQPTADNIRRQRQLERENRTRSAASSGCGCRGGKK